MLGPVQKSALNEIERRFMQFAEPAMTAASAAIAEPVSGFVGLAALPYGSDVASQAIERTQQAMTYQPRTEGGLQGLQALQNVMAPVGEAFEGASSYLGDATYEATGSPALGAAAYSIPAAGLELLGLKGARALPGRRLEFGDIGKGNVGSKQRGIFAGVRAQTADLDALKRAQDMAEQGAKRDEIWKETGWFKDVDGNWKFEIDDSAAAIKPLEGETWDKVYQASRGSEGAAPAAMALEDLMDAQDLQRAYPETPGVTFENYKGRLGQYDRDADLVTLDQGTLLDDVEGRSTLLHELQHSVQSREGFARGGVPLAARYALDEAESAAKRPLQGDVFEFNRLSRRLDPMTKADYIDSLNKIIGKESPKPSSVTNMSDFYRYSDDIRRTFGAMPNKAGAARDEWVKNAAQYIRRKNLDEMDWDTRVEVQNFLEDPAKLKKEMRKLERQRTKLVPRLREFQDVERKYGKLKGMEDFELYQRLAGEAEARNVQARRDFTPEQRRQTPPWETLDVPEGEQVIRK